MKEGFVQIDSLSIASDFESVHKVESLIDTVCDRLSVNQDYYGNVLIAVTEAVNNAIIHGNKHDAGLNVDLFVGDKETDFCFSVKDLRIFSSLSFFLCSSSFFSSLSFSFFANGNGSAHSGQEELSMGINS